MLYQLSYAHHIAFAYSICLTAKWRTRQDSNLRPSA